MLNWEYKKEETKSKKTIAYIRYYIYKYIKNKV